MKKILVTLLILVGVFAFTGCNFQATFTVNEDGSVDVNSAALLDINDVKMSLSSMAEISAQLGQELSPEEQAYYDAISKVNSFEELKALLAQKEGSEDILKDLQPIVIDGVEYMTDPDMSSTSSYKADELSEMKEYGIYIDTKTFVMDMTAVSQVAGQAGVNTGSGLSDLGSGSGMEEALSGLSDSKFTFTVNLPQEIEFTNGVLSEDKKSATFKVNMLEIAEAKLYAYSKGSEGIIDFNVKDGGFTKSDKVLVDTPDKITSLEINGNSVSGTELEVLEDGEYTVSVRTETSDKKITFTKDSKKPVVKGVKNGKTYTKAVTIKFSDATSGIKSAKLNGKKIKSGKKITKAGTYKLVVKDNAGNKKTVKFTIADGKKTAA